MSGPGHIVGGISTVLTMYTVAFAVGTLPHTMDAFWVPTTKSGSFPEMVRSAPSSVLWVPASSSGFRAPAMTWYVRILVSAALSASTDLRVFGGIWPKASLVGAKTVRDFCELRVSTSPALVTAVTSVDRTGLALAAEATGAVAMPLNEPAPVFGTGVRP